MREIKFRAWHIAEQKMCNVELLRPGNGAFLPELIPEAEQVMFEGRAIVPALESGRYCDICEFHLMQYTGLKDKNGKEIYEGDIISHNGGEHTCKVIFEKGAFQQTYITGSETGITRHLSRSAEFCEVIGNIHETIPAK